MKKTEKCSLNFLKTENNNSTNLLKFNNKSDSKFSSEKPQENEEIKNNSINSEIIIFDTLYYEVSAKSGINITECVELTTKIVLYDKFIKKKKKEIKSKKRKGAWFYQNYTRKW